MDRKEYNQLRADVEKRYKLKHIELDAEEVKMLESVDIIWRMTRPVPKNKNKYFVTKQRKHETGEQNNG